MEKEEHTITEWNDIYLARAERLLFWAKILQFFGMKKFPQRLLRKAIDYHKIIKGF